MVLIGVDSDGEAVMPLNVSNLSGSDFDRESEMVSKQIAPLMRKIRSNWGQNLLGYIKAKWANNSSYEERASPPLKGWSK